MRPLIGIPLCLDERGRWKPDRVYQYTDAAYARSVEAAGGIPVHLPLQADAEALARRSGRTLRRRSHLGSRPLAEGEVLLLDSMGELPALFARAAVAFVGGSLVPVGGHNLLEPILAGRPVLFGPHTEHFQEPAEALERAAGAERVRHERELADAVARLLHHDERRREMARRARAVVDANRGALARSVDLLLRARSAYLEGEKYMEWHRHPEAKKAFYEERFRKESERLDREKTAGDLTETEFGQRLELARFRRDEAVAESSLKYAYHWYKTAVELFSPPESRWVRISREKMNETKELWKRELDSENIPYEEYMLE